MAGYTILGMGPSPLAEAQCEADRGSSRRIFTKEEVEEHRTKEKGIWVTYRGGVYDVTQFVEEHPGGSEKIMLAAGGSVEPFWALYQQHKAAHVKEILEGYRIGDLEGDGADGEAIGDPFANEPARLPIFKVLTEKPFNGETPRSLLGASLWTPNSFFFVRNHLPVPVLERETFTVEVGGLGVKQVELRVEDLRRMFRKHEITAALQCSGNRRSEMAKCKPIKGLDWEQGAIGNAKWGGVLLRDVLLYAGVDPSEPGRIRHVHFEGADQDLSGTRYGASIPIEKALSREAEVLLAFEMNGEELPRDHGYPLRVVVPGVTAARSVKWVSRIILSDRESSSHWQQEDYKLFPNTVDWHNVDWSSAKPMYDTNVQSAICEPESGSVIEVDPDSPSVSLKGFAYSGGGRSIDRVDVSFDNGKLWFPAQIEREEQPLNKAWGWVLWKCSKELPPFQPGEEKREIKVAVRAVDSSGNTQPETSEPIWNLRGLGNNQWHRISLTLKPF